MNSHDNFEPYSYIVIIILLIWGIVFAIDSVKSSNYSKKRTEEMLEKPYKTFELKKEHIKLMKHANMEQNNDYDYLPVPSFDVKRPYGNSDVLEDIAKMIDYKPSYDREGMDEKSEEYLTKINDEMVIAVEIVLNLQTFELGKYEKNYIDGWRKVSEESNGN